MSPNPQDGGAPPPPPPPTNPDHESSDSSAAQCPPPPPEPSTDPVLVIQPPQPDLQPITSPQLNAQPDDIFKVPALAALKLLSAGVEALVRITGDIPPTPPPMTPHIPNMRSMQAEKESIVRNYSEKSLARLRDQELARQTQDAGSTPGPAATLPDDQGTLSPPSSQQSPAGPVLVVPKPTRTATLSAPGLHPPAPQPIDGVHLRPTPSPEPSSFVPPPPPSSTPEPYVVIGANSQPLNMQHNAITRKFYSKKPPPIGISDYLLRIHRFCPMSTAVYLATSLYIHRLAVDERAVAVTKRNAHRLLLAGLRVAMKALEDLSYPHAKVAKVGGVSELELARLEISFCFLCGFELVVGAGLLQDHWTNMKNGAGLGAGGGQGRVPLPGLSLANLPKPRNPPPQAVVEG
ncbi:putative cyclin-dependent protein kinase complex component [Diaporthe ampelina]|uniref:Putative cyclin-dependent protein kinase complex component n=1 Tax=Diaporthe ampelina TaxID=1214573 RepID=A0A0G2FD18_9PEZI|nr:putative cyclin-dependent protein kinase complex component [Diaporthe ampelina]